MAMMILQWLTLAFGLFLAAGTALSVSDHPHWFIRGWDFPRLQILVLVLLSGGAYAIFFSDWRWWEWLCLGLLGVAAGWQAWCIYPYTPLAVCRVRGSRRDKVSDDCTFRLVVSNVKMENDRYDRWMSVLRQADPDVIFALEVNEDWLRAIEPLTTEYPHQVRQPQENHYGMALFSKLELEEAQVHHVVQEDAPSIHTWVVLPNETRVRLHGLHPRPPEPLRDQPSAPRDAELVVVGRDIRREQDKKDQPTIVAGDLSDVAWSATTRLFLRVSGLLDPRQGRGLYTTFHASYPLFRFPLDHVFHSNDFELINLHRLAHVGSDHFPVCIDLCYDPSVEAEQPEMQRDEGDEQEAQEMVETQRDRGGLAAEQA